MANDFLSEPYERANQRRAGTRPFGTARVKHLAIRLIGVAGVFACVALCRPRLSHAETVRAIDTARISLASVLDTARDDLPNLDLGAAPPPGSSRVIVRQEVEQSLRELGAALKGHLPMPASVRIKSASRLFSATELLDLTRAATLAALPAGVTATRLTLKRAFVLSPRVEIGRVLLPKLPRRAGSTTQTIVIELLHDAEVVLRLPVLATLDIDAGAARTDITRGESLQLIIENGATRVTALAVALKDLDIGEVGQFRVTRTHKVLLARLESKNLARVEQP